MSVSAIDRTAAFHEAGHAWLAYWHFLRKGWGGGITLTVTEGEDVGLLGTTTLDFIRLPGPWYWTEYTAYCAAGSVAAGLHGEESGLWTWERWLTDQRAALADELQGLTRYGIGEQSDLSDWFQQGQAWSLPLTLEDYWRGWSEAETQLRWSWERVSALAQVLLERRKLTGDEVLEVIEHEGAR